MYRSIVRRSADLSFLDLQSTRSNSSFFLRKQLTIKYIYEVNLLVWRIILGSIFPKIVKICNLLYCYFHRSKRERGASMHVSEILLQSLICQRFELDPLFVLKQDQSKEVVLLGIEEMMDLHKAQKGKVSRIYKDVEHINAYQIGGLLCQFCPTIFTLFF